MKTNEFDIISKYFSPLTNGNKGALSLKDDAAVVQCIEGQELVVTKDSITGGIHFFENDDPFDIAKKLLGINLSDLASMGAKPAYYFLSFAIPPSIDEAWIKKFSQGFASMQQQYKGDLLGGDTIHTQNDIVLTLTAIGYVEKDKSIKRNGAKEGDLIFVSGTIGDSYLGLNILQNKLRSSNDSYFISRYHSPQPRMELGQKLVDLANCATDISDGLIADLQNICTCSGKGAKIYLDKVPLSEEAQEYKNIISDIVTAGDDYELLFTAPQSSKEYIDKISLELNLPITPIGQIQGNELEIIDKNGKSCFLEKKGYSHF